ncbi:MAG: tRNA (5-methylaminomethyl-2-thiouridylate)-methyltransferase [Candidatus Cloacimonadales bacterium]|jgi:tRNA U34 2-thiouridine synthase MnmA/TrmU|nr:tRNA (5-methylaminomethyl-2-thiouridylate)-methyltransferase [Candidatus Cloacimonadales bacterium]
MSLDKNRALSLFSGGLDSIIVVKFMESLGYEIIPVYFSTPFFHDQKAIEMAKVNDMKIEIIDITDEHLEMLVKPKYGYGKYLNPCIDCHGLMFKILHGYLDKYDADFMISGEVLQQRPMSQNKNALAAVRKVSTVGDLIVRPLSQRLLPDTLPIREGWVKKEEMLDISGRSRSKQMQMAEELGVKEYPNAGGGCLLTDNGYTKRLQDLLDHEMLNKVFIKFLAYGRHFRIDKDTKLLITRTKAESDTISPLLKDEIIIKCKNVPGPFGVIQSSKEITEEIIKLSASILIKYNSKANDTDIVTWGKAFELNNDITVSKIEDNKLKPFKIN